MNLLLLAVHTAETSATDGSLYDEAAMLGAVGAFITTIVVLIRQGRHRHRTDENLAKLQTIEDTLNHTDIEVTTPDGPATLGQRVVQLQRTVESGFARNDETHVMLGDAVHQVGARVDGVQRDLDRTDARVSQHHPDQGEPQ